MSHIYAVECMGKPQHCLSNAFASNHVKHGILFFLLIENITLSPFQKSSQVIDISQNFLRSLDKLAMIRLPEEVHTDLYVVFRLQHWPYNTDAAASKRQPISKGSLFSRSLSLTEERRQWRHHKIFGTIGATVSCTGIAESTKIWKETAGFKR